MSRRTVYNVRDEPVKYTFLDRLLGPVITPDDMFKLEARAMLEGWLDWFQMIQVIDNKKKRRWLLAYLRDEIIRVEVHVIDVVYDDDDPYEGMG